MGWKIVFNYADGGRLKVSSNARGILTKELAEKYKEQYAKSSNDGGMVYNTPYKSCKPIPLNDYINGKGQ